MVGGEINGGVVEVEDCAFALGGMKVARGILERYRSWGIVRGSLVVRTSMLVL